MRDAALRALDLPSTQNPPQDTSDIQTGRFFVVGGYFSNKRIADILRENEPEAGSSEGEDNFPVEPYGFDVGKSRDVLGMEYRSLETCAEDAGRAILELAGEEEIGWKGDVDMVNGVKLDNDIEQ